MPSLLRPRTFTLGWVAALVVLACSPRTDAPPTGPVDGDREARMQQHFEDISAVKDAVIDGDVQGVATLAQAIAEGQEPERYPLAWRPHVLRLVEAADATRRATDIPSAATRAAELATTCGECHRAVQSDPRVAQAPLPPTDDSVSAVMLRHQWAADRMWEGIVRPSPSDWDRGTTMFVRAPGCAVDPDASLSATMTALCDELRVFGNRAAAARTEAERAAVYGDFLGTCAACHNAGA